MLIAAPTGSGKTLAAFLAAIDGLVRQGLEGAAAGRDAGRLRLAAEGAVERHPAQPRSAAGRHPRGAARAGLAATWTSAPGCAPATRRKASASACAVARRTSSSPRRSRSTSCSARESGRAMLATTRTVIVDEIHALAPNKRGAHLALSLERLAALCCGDRCCASACRPRRSRSRGGALPGRPGPDGAPAPGCTIIDVGHRRARDLALEVPSSPLEAVMSGEVWEQVYDRLAELIEAHRTTLIFVNTRRMAERVARQLAERLGDDQLIAAHHGSSRQGAAAGCRAAAASGGELKALVATASLELGIDIGDVDSSASSARRARSPASCSASGAPVMRSTARRRAGCSRCRATSWSNARRCSTASAAASSTGWSIPEQPLDVLAQQIVAEVAAREWSEDELYALVRRAWPYRALAREDFDDGGRHAGRGLHHAVAAGAAR